MVVKETEALKKEIENHKKALEKYEYIPFPVKRNNQVYYAVRYTRFKKEKGLLIVSTNGQAVGHDAAVQVCEQIIHYYSAINFVEHILIPLTERPVWQFEELLVLMDELNDGLTEVKEDV